MNLSIQKMQQMAWLTIENEQHFSIYSWYARNAYLIAALVTN